MAIQKTAKTHPQSVSLHPKKENRKKKDQKMFGQNNNYSYLCRIAWMFPCGALGVYIDEIDVYETAVPTVTNFPISIRYQADGSVALAHSALSCVNGWIHPSMWHSYIRLCTGVGRPSVVYPVTERQGKACDQRDRQTARSLRHFVCTNITNK